MKESFRIISYREFLELNKSELSKYLMSQGNPKDWKNYIYSGGVPGLGVTETVCKVLNIEPSAAIFLNMAKNHVIKKPLFHGYIYPAFSAECDIIRFIGYDFNGRMSCTAQVNILSDGSVRSITGGGVLNSQDKSFERIIDAFSELSIFRYK